MGGGHLLLFGEPITQLCDLIPEVSELTPQLGELFLVADSWELVASPLASQNPGDSSLQHDPILSVHANSHAKPA